MRVPSEDCTMFLNDSRKLRLFAMLFSVRQDSGDAKDTNLPVWKELNNRVMLRKKLKTEEIIEQNRK